MASPSLSRRVCVTGGGGYIASWLVKLLLARGYAVHATVRDSGDPKNAHVASPLPSVKAVDPESEVLAPAVKGTLNILQACSANNVRKVVVVSSTSAVHFNPNWPRGKPKDESCWSDRNLCLKNEDWYMAAKTIAEETALEYAEKNGLTVVTVCPCLVLGPLLQPVVNTSSEFLIYVIKGDEKTAHLKRLPSASDPECGLRLFRADLLDYDAMAAAIAGCQGVFHVTTPVPSGNLTDPEDWYSVAKITSEEVALEYGRQIGLDVVTINPALVLGPLLQPMCNTSCQFLIYFLKGGPDRMRDKPWHIVGVRGVADALLLLYEAPGASGRHICAPHFVSARDLLRLLKRMYPGYPCINEEIISDMDNPAPMTSDKLRKLGWSYRPLEETTADTVEFCEQAGFLGDLQGGAPCRFPPVHNKI